MDKALKSSSVFFSQLQNNKEKAAKEGDGAKKKKAKTGKTGGRFKL